MNTTPTLAFIVFVHFASFPLCALTIPTVPIGNPGNAADKRYMDSTHPNGVGSVSYTFRVGMTEVTNTQYTEFLNAVAASDTYGLYDVLMGASTDGGIVRNGTAGNYAYSVKTAALGGSYSYAKKPVVFVSWDDAIRFVNWLHNGQPSGPQNASTTEDGAYSLNGATTDAALSRITRNSGARWWLPNEDEWYKAAYHKNDGITASYWDYSTATNSVPNNNLPASDTGNSANYRSNVFTTGNSSYPLTDAGAYDLSESSYGTFDQGGNVTEWTETRSNGGSLRLVRGGSWFRELNRLHASYWGGTNPSEEGGLFGFRVAGIPEPSSAAIVSVVALVLSLCRYKRI